MPGQDLQYEGCVFHGSRHGADVVERPGQRRDTKETDAAVGGFQPDDAAKSGGDADRTAGIRTERTGAQPRGYGYTRAAAGAARIALHVPGVIDPAEIRTGCDGGELVHVELAQQHGAGRVQPLDHRRVISRDLVFEHLGAARGFAARGGDDVFVSERNAVERTAIGATADLVFGYLRLAQRPLGGHGDIAIKLGIERLDAVEVSLRDLHWRHRSFADLLGEL